MTQETPDITPPPRRPLWRRLLRWTLRVGVVLIVLGLVAWAAINFWSARTIRAEIERLRANRQPVTFNDLDAALPKVDEANDAGPYYAAAMALARDVDVDLPGYDDALLTGDLTPAMRAEAQRRLEANRLALEMLDRGSAMPECGFDMGVRYGMAVSVQRIDDVRKLANAASLRTRLLAIEGQGDRAAESAIASLRLLRALDRQPVLVSHLVRIGCMALFSQDVRLILEQGQASAEALTALGQALADAENSADFEKVCRAERVFYLEMVRVTVAGGRPLQANDPFLAPLPERLPNNLGTRMMVAQTLPSYGRFIDAAAQGFPRVIDAMQAFDQEHGSSRGWAGIITPSMHRATVQSAHGLAMTRAARVAVMIEQHRLAHGHLPKTLADLPQVDGIPADPFSGQALIYRVLPDGYIVYSVGRNRRDDGGADGKDGDVTIMVRLKRD